MGEIIIKGEIFTYDSISLTYENASIIDSNIARNNLLSFKKILDEHHVQFLIMHGTLLGAIREHDFIKHDIDIDTCVINENALIELIPLLKEKGLLLCRHIPHVIYTFIKDNVYIDVYIVNKLQGLIRPFYVRYLERIIPRKYFIMPGKIKFIGETFRIPNHSLQLLEFWYGENWRTPISDSPSNDEDKRGSYLEKNRRFLFRPIHKIIK